MNNQLKPLLDIFRGSIEFVIPDYQRGYSWETTHRNDLWEDITNITGSRRHYTGMFTFCIDKQNPNIYYVVDGQQRMTTLIILLNEILTRILDYVDEYGTSVHSKIQQFLYLKPLNSTISHYKFRFQYSVDDPSNYYFKIKILGLNIPGIQLQDTLYTRNLQMAKEEFAKHLDKMNTQELRNLFKKITEQLVFNEYIIDDEADVYVTFETMNNRGKSLSTLELLKNRLIYLTTIFPDTKLPKAAAATLRTHINNTWKLIYQVLGNNTDKVLGDDDFLKDHWIMYFRYDRKTSMVFKEDLLNRYFTAKKVYENKLSPKELEDYIFSLSDSIAIWYRIKCPNAPQVICPEDEKVWLTRLDRVRIGSFRPLLMAAYLKKGDESIIPLLSACERFRFLIPLVTERRSNTGDHKFYGMAHQFYHQKGQKTIAELAEEVKADTNYWFRFDSFVTNCVERYKNNREGFYEWKAGLRYLLYEYERHLQMGNKDKTILCNWDDIVLNQANITSIEHIYPQTATAPYWQKHFADNHLLNSLGNLLLLSLAKNIAEQNREFDEKKHTIYTPDKTQIIRQGYDLGSHSERLVFDYTDWTPKEIIERGKILLKFLVNHWEIDPSVLTDDNIAKILNIHSATPVASTSQTSQFTYITPLDDDSLEETEEVDNEYID